MPLPERYIKDVQDVHAIWQPLGSFKRQGELWVSEAQAKNEIRRKPTKKAVQQLRRGLELSPEEIDYLNEPTGHETNRYLGVVRSHVPEEIANEYHEGNTSSDTLDTATSLQMRESTKLLITDFQDLADITADLALKYRKVLRMGRSHGQHAFPSVAGRLFLSWHAEIKRGVKRLEHGYEVMGVGKASGEIGTHVFIEPDIEERAMEILGLVPDEAPTQVISRDRHAETISMLAVNAGTLSKIATDIRIHSIPEIGEIEEPEDKGGVHSSSMPHKRNPEKCERVCGLARIIRSAARSEMDAQDLWMERDISHSATERFVFPDAFEGLAYMARVMKGVLKDLVVNDDRMLENMNMLGGVEYSPGLMNALLSNGMPRPDAYKLAQGYAKRAMKEKTPMYDLVLKDERIMSALGRDKVDQLFDPDFYLRNMDVAYRRVGLIK